MQILCAAEGVWATLAAAPCPRGHGLPCVHPRGAGSAHLAPRHRCSSDVPGFGVHSWTWTFPCRSPFPRGCCLPEGVLERFCRLQWNLTSLASPASTGRSDPREETAVVGTESLVRLTVELPRWGPRRRVEAGPPWTRRPPERGQFGPDGWQDPDLGSSLRDQGLGLEKTAAVAAALHKRLCSFGKGARGFTTESESHT